MLITTHFGKTGSEEYALVDLGHGLQEFVHVWPFEHIDLMHHVVDLHANLKVSRVNSLGKRQNKL